jgi:transmembrane sensor
MNYKNLTVEELAGDERFINWVKGNCTEEEKDFWRTLLLSHPSIQDKIDRAAILVKNIGKAEERLDPVRPQKVRQIWQNILEEIDKEHHEVEQQNTERAAPRYIPERSEHTPVRWLMIAAVIAGILSLAVLGTQKFWNESVNWYSYKRETTGFIEVENRTDTTTSLQIADGSVILLEPDSRVKYKTTYASDTMRRVYLEGEAFFQVARNPQKPFVVFTNNVVTEVLGTSFRIKSDASTEKVTVAVKTGKVSVYSAKTQNEQLAMPKNGVVLLPNQQVIYDDQANMFERKIVEEPELLADAPDRRFQFDNTSIDSVFAALEQAYGVEVVYDHETMKHCFLTVALGSESLFEKLNVICKTVGASYEIIDAKVVVTSAGCKVLSLQDQKTTKPM